MKIKISVLILTLALFVSCNVNRCDYYCDSGPIILKFEIVDKESGENLFTNGTYSSENLQVIDLNNNDNLVQFEFISENNLNQLLLGPFGFEVQEAKYAVLIHSETIFSIALKTIEEKDTCCSTILLDEFSLNGAEFTQDEATGVYKVLIEV